MKKPLAIDLCAGLGGWSEGLIAEGWFCVGFDIERHVYGEMKYPGQLVIQDILSLNGAQFRSADLIVASPPCQFFSYVSMPWSRGKALAAKVRADPVLLAEKLALFNACFRIQREACEAAGRHIPMVVENVKGAQPWVGRARWSFGSFYLWGDIPALMPPVVKASKVPGFRFDGRGGSFQTASVEHTGFKTQGMNWSDRSKTGQDFTRIAGKQALDGRKGAVSWLGEYNPFQHGRNTGSGSKARKMASAVIAKIPLPLSQWIAATYRPQRPTRGSHPLTLPHASAFRYVSRRGRLDQNPQR